MTTSLNRPLTRGGIYYGTFYEPKPHPMDAHYPHECQQCKKPLRWSELFRRNARILSFRNSKNIIKYDYEKYKQLKQWWRSKHVEFLCCSCFAIEKQKKKIGGFK